MAGKILIDIQKPITQTVEAVKALLAWRGRAAEPLPSFVELSSNGRRCVLVLSNKKDCFYVTTARDCSCPARNWHPNGPCKHMRRYFPESKQATKPGAAAPNTGKWHGHNGPWIEEERMPAKAPASSIHLVDTTPDAAPAELANHIEPPWISGLL